MVDDKLHGHRKTARASVESMGLWVLAGSWCADHLTDGFIPDYIARRLDPKVRHHAASLVAAGFWTVAERDGDKGWQFHDWGQLQPTREQVETKREQAKERMRRVREQRTGSREVRANEQRSSRGVALTPSQPSPTQPIPSIKGGEVSGGGLTSVRADTRPPRTCPKHEGMDDPPPCGKCADARKAHDAWQKPTLSAKTTMCGDHPKRRALNCPDCASEVAPPPEDWRQRA